MTDHYVNNPEQLNNNVLERDLAYYLKNCTSVNGYALIGYKFTDSNRPGREIDALVILDNWAIICIEAKNYGGIWTGAINGEWFCDERRIACPEGFANPQQQVERGCFIVKNRLEN
ncbi:MAG: hypothetical protein N5P05_002246 [Chroococcopsis gigantea SAG 12.99]|nr:hypothetical protein [Chroococcopsis gigantea SAG 12.99]